MSYTIYIDLYVIVMLYAVYNYVCQSNVVYYIYVCHSNVVYYIYMYVNYAVYADIQNKRLHPLYILQ